MKSIQLRAVELTEQPTSLPESFVPTDKPSPNLHEGHQDLMLGRGRRARDVPMTRADLIELLARLEQYIALGDVRIARLREVIAERDRDGQSALLSRKLLKTFLASQSLRLTGRRKVLSELANPVFTVGNRHQEA